jgi:hypothetical protein
VRIFFVADGHRDRVTLPVLVGRILETKLEIQTEDDFREWKSLRLHGGGYTKKLSFALRSARVRNCDGVVATIDRDKAKSGDRLAALNDARTSDRCNPRLARLPAAIGEAVPHLEAWLLDDPKAIREVLKFPGAKPVPNVIGEDSKARLHELIAESGRTDTSMDLLPEFARELDYSRCNHAKETGFQEFRDEVHSELGPLVVAK